MRNFIFTFCLFFNIPAFSITIDSVKVDGSYFQFWVPRKWEVVSKDTGICFSNTSNVSLRMPQHVPGSFGEINISISEITYKERDLRRSADTLPTDANSDHNWVKKTTVNGYKLTNAHLLTERLYKKSYWDSLQGDTPYTGKEKRLIKRYGQYPIHYLSHLSHFLINDSLEILIQFNGDVVNDAQISYLVDHLTEIFFTRNKKEIDALLVSADPYRFEPPIKNYDSIYFLNTMVRYPILPEWNIDTTRSSTDIRTKVLQFDHVDNDSCNHGSITMQYRVTKLDNQSNKEDFEKLTLGELYKLYKPYKDLSDPEKVRYRDSTFNVAERHYYFARHCETVKSENCRTKLDCSETIFITIYTQSKEKIRISVILNEVTGDFIQERNYRHDLYRFVNLTSEATDFEQFYLNNKTK